jgi:eukaryotic-like serine/threonine-protein kinase
MSNQLRARLWDYEPSWIRLGEWLVKPTENSINNGACLRAIEPKLMDLLLWFAMHPGEVQSNEILLKEIWGGTFYSDNPLHRSVAMLRRALGDDSSDPKFIQTVRKRGYQLIAQVGFPDSAPTTLDESAQRFASRCPFPGLDAFASDDSAVFFGRGGALSTLQQALAAQWAAGAAIVLILGPSGCGKSSLLNAGLVPQLCSAASTLPVPVADHLIWDCSASAVAEPITQFFAALCRLQIAGSPIFLVAQLQAVWRDCAGNTDQLVQFVLQSLVRAYAAGNNARNMFLLVIDHLEVLATKPAEQVAHLDQIFAHLARSGSVIVLLVGRSDFYHGITAQFPASTALKGGAGHFDVPPPTPGEISQMIRGPARIAGLSFERQRETNERLDDVLRDAALTQPDALPMLQFTLESLYEQRAENGLLTFSAYEKMGRLEGALVQRAESALANLIDVEAGLTTIFQRMVLLDAHHRSPTARWVAWSELDFANERKIVEELVRNRLLVSQNVADHLDNTTARFRPAHDALLRRWPRAVAWCAQNQRMLEIHARIRPAVEHWIATGRRRDELLNSGRPVQEATELLAAAPLAVQPAEREFITQSMRLARRRERRRHAGILSITVLAALASIAGLYAQRQRHEAEQRKLEVEGTVDFLLEDLADKLRPLGRLDLLGAVGDRAFAHYQLNPEQSLDLAATVRRAKALRVIAESLVGRGDLAHAALALARAQQTLDGANISQSGDAASRLELATIHYWQGYLAYQDKDLARTQHHWQEYLAITSKLQQDEPLQSKWQLEVSYALNNLGTLAANREQWPTATEYFQRSQELKKQLLRMTPNDVALAADLADTYSWLGSAMEALGQLHTAQAQYQAEVDLLTNVAALAPGEGEWLYRLAVADLHRARLENNLGDARSAALHFDAAITRLSKLKGMDPSNRTWRYDLSYAWLQRGQMQASIGGNATSAYSQAQLEIDQVLADPKPSLRWRRLAALLQLRRSEVMGDKPSLAGLQQAVQRLSDLNQATPADSATRITLALAYTRLAQFESRASANAVDRDAWLHVVALLQPTDTVTDATVLDILARAYAALGLRNDLAQAMQKLAASGYSPPDYLLWRQALPASLVAHVPALSSSLVDNPQHLSLPISAQSQEKGNARNKNRR